MSSIGHGPIADGTRHRTVLPMCSGGDCAQGRRCMTPEACMRAEHGEFMRWHYRQQLIVLIAAAVTAVFAVAAAIFY